MDTSTCQHEHYDYHRNACKDCGMTPLAANLPDEMKLTGIYFLYLPSGRTQRAVQ